MNQYVEIKRLQGEYLFAREKQEQAFKALCSALLENGISQARTESPGTPMSLTVDEMANELKISRTTAYGLVKQEGFPAFHIGRKVLVNRRGLQRWMDEGGTENVKAC